VLLRYGRRSTTVVLPLLALLTTVGLPLTAAAQPWERTEVREPCSDYTALRRPYFGDLHIHTSYSADAYIFGTRGTPTDAYDFARGSTITIADDNEDQTRTATIDRPLDFAAVTDHAEFYGEVDLCSTPGSLVYDDDLCQLLRRAEPDLSDRFEATVNWLYPLGFPNPPSGLPICSTPGVDCDAAAASVWQQIQAAAEGAYDRTSACTFTSFIGYEYTASPQGRHLHRNVIFRNEHVPAIALSYIDTAAGGIPQGLWSAIESQCLDAGDGCDALIIPHNSNLSGGQQFFDPADAAEAERRQTLEPLVELHQVKGNSECRFDRLAGLGVGTDDELCTFEQRLRAAEVTGGAPVPINQYPARNMVREVLKDGLAFEGDLGVNPFRFGFIGSTDNHNATSGAVAEEGWTGAGGNEDSSPARQIGLGMRNNPGGLAVVWAEENSRDAVFAALRRRETYATSGTRPVVRFFAGDLDGVTCGQPDFVSQSYATGLPMGGKLAQKCDAASPRFAVWAMKDPGTMAKPGTDLQRVQIVKGWVDADGNTQEAVFDVAGDANNGAYVDTATCDPTGSGAAELCTVWEDPTFHPSQRAFYYVRVLEDPTCRWSTYVCKSVGVDPFSPDCTTQAANAGPDFADCCANETNDPFLSPTIQERAWTSPIWYSPQDVARLKGSLHFGTTAGSDKLKLVVRLAADAVVDADAEPITVSVRDDTEFYTLDVPAGTLVERRPGRFAYDRHSGLLSGVRTLKLIVRGNKPARLRLKVEGLDLSTVDHGDHAIEVQLVHGGYCPAVQQSWVARGRNLRTRFGKQ
jgi:hypothetical protein